MSKHRVLWSARWFGAMLRDRRSRWFWGGERSRCASGEVMRPLEICLQGAEWPGWAAAGFLTTSKPWACQNNQGWLTALGGNHRQTTSNRWTLPQTRQCARAPV